MKRLLQFILDILAELYIARFHPDIIAVTGNVGKTSTKEAISIVLSKVKKVRSGKGNLNNEFGVPLTIIGDWADDYYEAGNSAWFWVKVIIVSVWQLALEGVRPLFLRKRGLTPYPEVLVLEFWADRPGDIGRLTRKYKPKIGVVTAVGEIPVHVEYFSDPKGLAREKSKLISALKSSDYAVLNHDDPVVYEMREKTKAKVMSFGFSDGSMVRLSNFDFRSNENQKPEGIGFKVNYGENTFTPHLSTENKYAEGSRYLSAGFVPFNIYGSLGKSQAMAVGAAVCVGIIYEMNLIEISQALDNYSGPRGRLRILKGIKNSTIIDDTYNSSPLSAHLALETLEGIAALRQAQGKTTRKLVVLGDMLELGKYTIEAHEEMGNLAGRIADVLVTVGARAKFSAYSASNQMDQKNIFSFVNADLAKSKVQELIKNPPDGEAMGDLILVKGSQGMRMEKIVEEIMADPPAGGGKKKELLVRQGKKWLK